MKVNIVILRISVLTLLVLLSMSGAAKAQNRYALAQRYARQGNYEFALMSYRDVARDSKSPAKVAAAIFAQGEYFYLQHDFAESQKSFQELQNRDPRSDVKLFSLAYLWKIAGEIQDSETQMRLAQEIVALKQVSMIFRKSKTYRYLSPLYREHNAVFAIDQIEFFVNGKSFAKIHY